MAKQPFASFMKAHCEQSAAQLKIAWEGKAFLVGKDPTGKPWVLDLTAGELPAPFGDQFTLLYHRGLAGWTVCASGKVRIDSEPIRSGRLYLLKERAGIRSAASPETRLQFYTAAELIRRLRRAGATTRPLPRAQPAPTSSLAPSLHASPHMGRANLSPRTAKPPGTRRSQTHEIGAVSWPRVS